MQRIVLNSILLASILSMTSGVLAADPPATGAFEKLKSLAGEWRGETAEGDTAVLKTRLASNGTVLVEDFTVIGKDGMDMVTTYHVDGDGILLTHYCMAGNQPRMRAVPASADPGVLSFSFVDASNLASHDEGHMYKVVFRLEDEDHMTQEWTFRKDGKDAFTEVVHYERQR